MIDLKIIKILWVDDKIVKLSAFVTALASEGFEVLTAAGTNEAIDAAGKSQFDICLIDLNMPDPDGIECIRQLVPLQQNAKFAVLSSYLYKARYQDELRRLELDVQLIDKDFVAPSSPGFREQFLDPILKLAREGVTTSIRSQDDVVATVKGKDPFAMRLADFIDLPGKAKDELRIAAERIAQQTLTREFSEGKLWVMLCGDPNAVRASATSPTEFWDEEEIMEFGRVQQRVPYIFWNDVAPDDIEIGGAWRPCGNPSDASYYPTVSLEFGDQKITVHFDTGSPLTFFSYEELLSLEVIRPTSLFGQHRRKYSTKAAYWATPLRIRARLRCQGSGQCVDIDIRGQAVRDWEEAPFARFCTTECPGRSAEQQFQRLCPDRKALIGRNLLIENALVLVLDGGQKKTLLQ